ncbi:hypothetical protein BDV33DRAFT_197200 [Aspergillus novoparasiticus]|uniref:Uncharacterized protein n=1 Tax=Aspergillus novoparasiticus TaxID=986946 RepID=A0A5N6E8Y1_9EURO|nr:hypothetical protein BDV33DRAFT_197200 [Aspergillus novoparasiticus]
MAEPAVSTANLVQSKSAVKSGYCHVYGIGIYATEPEDSLVITRNDIERENLFVLTNVINLIAQIRRVINASPKKLHVNWGYHGRGQNHKEGPFDRSVYVWQSYHDGI